MLLADSVKVPVPALVKEPSPDTIPEIVSSPESPIVKVIPLVILKHQIHLETESYPLHLHHKYLS